MKSPSASPIRRQFLGWDQPALPVAARLLADRYRQGETLNLGSVIVVVPGQRAGRRLQELLAFLADDEKLCFTPPRVVTEGKLPEMLYTPKLPFATDIVQDLVWAQALRDLPPGERRPLAPHPPAPDDAVRWLELGKVLRRLHRELAADGLNFAKVLERAPKLADFNEANRWQTLVEIQRRYHELLDKQFLWDIQTARLVAIDKREIENECDIILLGAVDLNDTLRQMLDQTAARVTAFIVAPDGLADRFDAHGCLIPGKWSDAETPLRDDQLGQVDGAEDQADAVSEWLASVSKRYRTDEVAIGVPDEALVPQLQRQLAQCDVNARWVEGVRLTETGPYRLLAAAADYAGGRRYEDLAALLRHPDLESWLTKGRELRAGSLPAQLDRFYNEVLPSVVRSESIHDDDSPWPDLKRAIERVERWLADAQSTLPLRAWGDVFRDILGEIYGKRFLEIEKSPDDEVLYRTLRKLLQECDRLSAAPAAIDTATFSAADALRLALDSWRDEFLPPGADADAVEILGWLELPLDDAPALVVTSFNEGFVPKSAGADAFLPDRLRRELNLLHNERRYARDAYAVNVLCHSRRDLRVLFARRDTKKDPLQPSRLLFACPDRELVARARKFFGKPAATATPRRLFLAPEDTVLEQSLFAVPRPEKEPHKLERISVTQFKAYLACPYRYYLRHVRNLKAVDDAGRELGGDTFGTLLHHVLSLFGRAPAEVRDSDRPQPIFEFLADQLSTQAGGFDAKQCRPAVRLQIEQARRRLGAFAAHQAQLVRDGWRILYAEDDREERLEAPFVVDDLPIALSGRIDRIDLHEPTKTLRILDYKTADSGKSPEKTHRSKDDWIDLQLPLYRHLSRAVPLAASSTAKIALGYFNLPKQLDQTTVVAAEWDETTLETADEKARQVIRGLRNSEFWPPVYSPLPDYCEDLSAICLDNLRCPPNLDDDGNGGSQ